MRAIDHERSRATEAIYARMDDGEPFTLGDLRRVAGRYLTLNAADRLADRVIQFRRKRMEIRCTRIGRQTVWTLTQEPAP